MALPGRTTPAPGGIDDKYRFGFNGKEKDNDIALGDYDFGDRIQDSRLGRWLSIDPMASKYPSHSPYNFALNNPLYYFDIDGNDVGVSITNVKKDNGKITVSAEIVMNVKLINLSNKNLSPEAMKSYINDLKGYASGTFSGKGSDKDMANIEYNITFKLNIEEVSDVSKISSKDHVLAIVDDIPQTANTSEGNVNPLGLTNGPGGSVIAIESNLFSNDDIQAKSVALHEIGHSLALDHSDDIKNLMHKYRGSWNITDEQRHTIGFLGVRMMGNVKTGQKFSIGGAGAGLKHMRDFFKSYNIKTKYGNGKVNGGGNSGGKSKSGGNSGGKSKSGGNSGGKSKSGGASKKSVPSF